MMTRRFPGLAAHEPASRTRAIVTTVLASALLLSAARVAAAQDMPRPAERSTLAGVYTEEQATRGRNVFLGSCKSCHAPESQVGAIFNRMWAGKLLLELFRYVSEAMPENDPGSLAPAANADVVAYLLQLNSMPAGKTELAADSTALREIKVEIKDEKKEPPPKSGGRRK
jgi:mono/diheme cytochrome c family protein